MDDLSGLSRGLGSGGGASGGAGSRNDPAAISRLLAAEGGLSGLLDKLRGAGLGDHVDSWIRSGPNKPIDASQLRAALGEGEVRRLSGQGGLDLTSLLPLLAAFLPQIVDMLTPDGQVPDGGLDGALGGGLGDLGGLLGGLGGLGGGGTSDSGGGVPDIGDLLGG